MVSRGRHRQSGEGNLGCLFWTVALLITVLISWKAIPVKLATSQLQDFMVEQAKFSVRAPPQSIRSRIVSRAIELGLPVTRRDVVVQRSGGRIEMRCSFTVPLEFPFYTYYWDFDLDIERSIYQF